MEDQGWFVFSTMPDVIYSRTFNGSFPALGSWAALRDVGSGAAFRVVNIHTDFRSSSNRTQSIELVAERVRRLIEDGETVLVVGDFNVRHGSSTLKVLKDVGLRFLKVDGTTYYFNRGLNLFRAIDHIGLSGATEPVGEPVVLRQKFDGEWPTDHYPVVLDVTIGQ